MITVKLLEPEVFEVTDTMHGWDGDIVQKWYYDFNRRILSEKAWFPPTAVTRDMSGDQAYWFNKYHRSKAS